ncbi:MAG: phosphatase [Actinobacteria bacterium]|nr:phosphatase [Actinomycetota bacterium]
MRLIADLHIHTVASGHAYSTIEECAKAALLKGLKYIAICDHGPALLGGASLYYFWNMRVLPKEIHGVRVLKGVEANIINSNGEIDLTEEVLKTLDIVCAGFHPVCDFESRSARENTKTLIKTMENPFVDIIVHPGNPYYPIEIDKLIEAAKKHQVYLEINNSSFFIRTGSYEKCFEIAKAAFEAGIDITINSDAHTSESVGNFSEAIELAEKAGFTAERVLNSSAERIERFLGSRKT